MKKTEWPGIATAVGIVLILALVIVGSRDDFHLKDWQTLIAGAFALFGGTLAYWGAMAKVKQDGDLHRREFLRRQLSLYLKLDITVRNFRDTANEREAKITFVDPGAGISVGELDLEEPPELGEAWENLDVFPRHLIREIASIREGLRRLEVLMDGLPNDRQIVAGDKGGQTRLDLVHEQIGAIADSCAVIADGLAPEIERLAPFLPDQKRLLALYGEPSDD
jgi:hypothetical protein